MANNELAAMVNFIEKEHGVNKETVLTAIEHAIEQAARKSPDVTNDFRVSIDRDKLTLRVFDTFVASDEETGLGFIPLETARRRKPDIQPGDTIELELPPRKLGRIVAAMSKQMIMQKIRDAERVNTYAEYKDRVNDIVSGVVSMTVKQDTYVTVNHTEMILPRKERLANEEFAAGDNVRAVILRVDQSNGMAPSVVLSRSSPQFLRALLRLEVSEIAEGVVEIMGITRLPGYRAKLAVRSLDDNVDPIGACVGVRGSRVRNIVRELNGEKIDIVRWSADPVKYVAEALGSGIKFESIEVDPDAPNTIRVTVAQDQYSSCLGVKGQNVRLATRLTGWHIDIIKSKEAASFDEKKDETIKTLAETFDIDEATATKIVDAGYLTVDGILASDESSFAASTGLDTVTASGIYAAAAAVADLTSHR